MMVLFGIMLWFFLGLVGATIIVYVDGELKVGDLGPLFLLSILGPIGLICGIVHWLDQYSHVLVWRRKKNG